MPAPKKAFVPKGYEVKSGGGSFFNLQGGENKFRILTDAVIGKEGWKDNKPFRRLGDDAVIEADEVDIDSKTKRPKVNDFMAFMVYDYKDAAVKLAVFTQATIRKALVGYATDEDWGHPEGYDITITKSGEGFGTKYEIKPSVPKPLVSSVQKVVDLEEEFFDVEGKLNVEEE